MMVTPSCPQTPEPEPSDASLKCDAGWQQGLGKCYYFSTTTSSWEVSRRLCQTLGGDLVKIDSSEEQEFLNKTLGDIMRCHEDKFWIGLRDLVKIDSSEEQEFLNKTLGEIMRCHEDKFWIGLTDSEEENKWIWVDGSPLNPSLSFWFEGEPDNWNGTNPEGEDCVRMGEKGGAKDLNSWFDRSCNDLYRSICEKPAQTGRHHVCV
ncbi:C-type lectin domain family 4 member E-like [Scomber japonicus]|uniref:C-type lectin domain family 4 member E-like n=1 Tax=Scomber japonicus TaxID=13676 RepID=UPI0023059DC4|nr:C-type lectin domain family 4 member E-like [Scomber japonicus]